jgi:hypothetical protein
MKIIEEKTKSGDEECIKFVKRTNQEQWIEIINDEGCWSRVGQLGERKFQHLSLNVPGCIYKGTVAHELIHALGFDHEQNRPDRDSYVEILTYNIQNGKKIFKNICK